MLASYLLTGTKRVKSPVSVQSPVVWKALKPSQLRSAYQEKFGIELFEGYGVTETSPVISVNLPGAHKPGSIGKPISAHTSER